MSNQHFFREGKMNGDEKEKIMGLTPDQITFYANLLCAFHHRTTETDEELVQSVLEEMKEEKRKKREERKDWVSGI